MEKASGEQGVWSATGGKQRHARLLTPSAPRGRRPQAGKADPTKFSGKKSKAAAKKGPGATQWQILRQSGIPEADIPAFRWAAPR